MTLKSPISINVENKMGLIIIVKCITDDQIYKLKKKGDKRDIYKEQNYKKGEVTEMDKISRLNGPPSINIL